MTAEKPAAASPLAGSFFSCASLGLMWKAGRTTSVTTTAPMRNTGSGRLVTIRAQRAQKPTSALGGLTKRFGMTRSRLIFGPSIDSIAGSSVIDASTETAGISIPPIPIERMNGSGSRIMLRSPIATVEPEMITERPACVIVSTSASSVDFPSASSSRNRKIITSA